MGYTCDLDALKNKRTKPDDNKLYNIIAAISTISFISIITFMYIAFSV